MNWFDWPLIAIDVETTGLDSATDRIIELGVARFEGGRCVHETSSFVHPERDPRFIDPKIFRLTQLDVQDLITAPPFWHVFMTLAPLFRDAIPVAYNAPFDKRFFLSALVRTWGRDASQSLMPATMSRTDWVDPLAISRHLFKLRSHRLADVARVCGLASGGRSAHNARHDAVLAGTMASTFGRMLNRELRDVLELQRRIRAEHHIGKRLNPQSAMNIQVLECDVCREITLADDPSASWAERNLTTCGPACDTIARWW